MANVDSTDVVIITALALERDAILRRLPNVERITTKGRVFYRSTLTIRGGATYSIVVLPLTKMGTNAAAAATTQAIDAFNPGVLFLNGIAGGVQAGLQGSLGDVIVAEQIVGYESAKVKNGDVSRRYDVYRPSHDLLIQAREFNSTNWDSAIDVPRPDGDTIRPKVHFGVIASGDKVVADVSFVEDIRAAWPKLIGIEMEAIGLAMGAYQSEAAPGVLVVKGISDWADAEKADDWQPYAADVSAAFTLAFLESRPFEPADHRPQPPRVSPFHFSGRHKVRLCGRLGDDWYDLADYFDIPEYHRRRFPQGRECQKIWEWLSDRSKLDGLPDALKFIEREDLAEILTNPL